MTRFSRLFFLVCLVSMFSLTAAAKDNPERTQFGRDIRVEAGEKAGEVTCIDCSVHIRGAVAGDVTTIHGNIMVESGGSVAGDVTAVWGDVRMESGSQIAGDLATVAGAVRRQPGSSIGGDVASLEGVKWLLAILLPPLVFIGLIIALIIWLVQRSRRPAPVAAPPSGVMTR